LSVSLAPVLILGSRDFLNVHAPSGTVTILYVKWLAVIFLESKTYEINKS